MSLKEMRRTKGFRHLSGQPALGKYKLKDLRPEHVQKFINEMADKGLSVGTLKIINRSLHGALEQAVDNDLIAKNVSSKVNFPKEEKKEMRVLSQEEQFRFVTVAKCSANGRAFILALYTGMRLGEVLALSWEDINLKTGVISVNKTISEYRVPNPDGKGYTTGRSVGSPKTESSTRDIPLLPHMLEMLKKEKERS